MSDVVLRPAVVADAEAIRTIYNHEVTTRTSTFDLVPRSLADQERWIAARTGAFSAIVAVDSTRPGLPVIGFASLSPYKDRAAYNTTVEDSVYVHADHRGEGIGRILLGELVRLAEAHGFHSVMARIVGGHEASIALHAACGFEHAGVEREVGRKFGKWLDVVLMQRLL